MAKLLSKKEGEAKHFALRIQNAVTTAKERDGRINIENLNKFLDAASPLPHTHPIGGLGKHGAEYYNNSERIVTGHGLIRGVAEGTHEIALADAVIYLPTRSRWKIEEKRKRTRAEFVQEMGIPKYIKDSVYTPTDNYVSGKTVAFAKDRVESRFPLQRKYIELAARIHNRIIQEPDLRDAVQLFAVVGGTFTRNIATIPVKVRLERRDRQLKEPEIFAGIIPDFDPFIILKKGAPPELKRKIIGIMREEARNMGLMKDLDHELVDTSRDIFAYEDEFDKIAHSLHGKKPKVIFHGMEKYNQILKHPEFIKHAEAEERVYEKKLRLIADAVISDAINRAIKVLTHLARSGEISDRDLHKVLSALKENFSADHRILISHADVEPMIVTAREGYNQEVARREQRVFDNLIANPKKMNRLLHLAMGDKETSRIMNLLMLSMGAVPDLSKRAQRSVLAAAALALLEGREKLGKNLREFRLTPLSPKIRTYKT